MIAVIGGELRLTGHPLCRRTQSIRWKAISAPN